MTATERVRELLDERGVEWMDDSYAQLWCTVWDGQDGKQWRMTENQSGMLTELKAWKVSPAQAIAATLGDADATSARQSVADLKAENAKLRELVRAAWRCIHTGANCSDCRLIAGCCTLQTAMRELGIEVTA